MLVQQTDSIPVKGRTCNAEGCDKPHVGKGLCKSHWRFLRKYGDHRLGKLNLVRHATEPERFDSYHAPSPDVHPIFLTPCWLWHGTTLNGGYGMFLRSKSHDCVKILAHRYAFERWFENPIPEGLQIDHMCKVRNCVNPHHLDLVTPEENRDRSDCVASINKKKTHCPQGHPYSKRVQTKKGKWKRMCTECKPKQGQHGTH